MTHPGNGRIVFTPERCAALAEDWQAGVDASAIMQRLNAMPCAHPVFSPLAVMDKARALGLKRPEGWARAKKRTAKARTWTNERRDYAPPYGPLHVASQPDSNSSCRSTRKPNTSS
jgi:hypothetical protein